MGRCWNIIRNPWVQDRPTADPQALDCDVILAAQALAMGATVVTDNVGHLALFVEAKSWRDIPVAEDTR
jgi:hypothetical protein